MTKTVRVNDLQLVLLAGAAQRENGSLIPLPDSCAAESERITKAIASLLRRGLVEEKPTAERSSTWRTEGEETTGLFITSAGLQAISARNTDPACEAASPGDGSPRSEASGHDATQSDAESAAPSPARTGSKIALVITLLERAGGATLNEMVEATGWLPHTTRAALTGLRKKGRSIEKAKRQDITCYRIAAGA
jgi:hypothetical protein